MISQDLSGSLRISQDLSESPRISQKLSGSLRVVTNTEQLPTETLGMKPPANPFKTIKELEVTNLIMSTKIIISSLKDLLIKIVTDFRNTRNTTLRHPLCP